jgi:hypothetical protein
MKYQEGDYVSESYGIVRVLRMIVDLFRATAGRADRHTDRLTKLFL